MAQYSATLSHHLHDGKFLRRICADIFEKKEKKYDAFHLMTTLLFLNYFDCMTYLVSGRMFYFVLYIVWW